MSLCCVEREGRMGANGNISKACRTAKYTWEAAYTKLKGEACFVSCVMEAHLGGFSSTNFRQNDKNGHSCLGYIAF